MQQMSQQQGREDLQQIIVDSVKDIFHDIMTGFAQDLWQVKNKLDALVTRQQHVYGKLDNLHSKADTLVS